jgi:hypothetical protein
MHPSGDLPLAERMAWLGCHKRFAGATNGWIGLIDALAVDGKISAR